MVEMYNSRPKDSQCSISELSSFVKKVGTIQELVDSVQTHLGVSYWVENDNGDCESCNNQDE